jgi:hypothetical protein
LRRLKMKKTINRVYIGGILCAAFIVFLFACVSLKTAENLVGVWLGDPALFFADPDIKKEIENNPMGDKMSTYLDSLVSNLRIEITPDTLTIFEQSPDEALTKIVVKYRVKTQTKDTVIIENTNSGGPEGAMLIRIIDTDHIKISPEKKTEGQPDFILKRLQ